MPLPSCDLTSTSFNSQLCRGANEASNAEFLKPTCALPR